MDQEHIALYRRFRPQTFDEISSQDAAVKTLRQAVKSGKIGHAYLFAGQRGTGKTTIAKVFSRAINCMDPKDGNPCNECEICKGILNGSLLDVIEIDAASNNGVENVRRICDEAVFAPTKAKYKVYIIDEVHMLSTGAYNALLKTLEEPPKHVVFLFATTEPHKILPTILSRCQKYYFKRIPGDLIVKRLRYICDKEDIKADDDALKQIAALSDGALRDAISLLDQAAGMAQGSEITAKSVQDIAGTADIAFLMEMADVLIEGNYESLLRLCSRIAEAGRDYVRFTLDLAEFFRDLLVIRVVPDPSELVSYSAADMKHLYQTANKANPDTLIGFISYFSKMASDMKLSPSVRSSFETSLIRICGRKTSLPITPLVIPDFEKKQAAAAAKISGETKDEPNIKEEKAVKEEIKAEDKTEKPAKSLFHIQQYGQEEETETVVKEEIKAESKEEPSLSVSERLEQLRASLSHSKSAASAPSSEEKYEEKPAEKPAEKVETVVSEPFTIITAPEEDDENKPMENQIDLFGSLEKKEEPKEEPKAEPKEEKKPEVKIAKTEDKKEDKKEEAKEEKKEKISISNLSDSFVDDIKPQKAEEPKKPKGKTSLSTVYDKSGLIVSNPHTKDVRQPEFGDSVPGNLGKWQSLLLDLKLSNPNLHRTLIQAEFMTIEENGYIVFEDPDKNIVENLKGMTEFRRLAQTIKSSFDGVGRLFVCTKTQYGNAVDLYEKRKKQSAAEAMRAKAEQMGIQTELHFGDD